jgi:hypothetical protein
MCGVVAKVSTTIAVSLLITGLVAAQNLVTNGDFANDVAGWTEGIIPLTWDGTSDYQNDPSSGSASILNNGASPTFSGATQCVGSVVAGENYRLSAWLNVPPGQTGSGYAQVLVWWYSQPACGGGWLEDLSTSAISSSGGWTEVLTAVGQAPATAQSALVYLLCYKLTSAGELQASFDHVVFSPNASVFADGFESGDTSAWSSEVP